MEEGFDDINQEMFFKSGYEDSYQRQMIVLLQSLVGLIFNIYCILVVFSYFDQLEDKKHNKKDDKVYLI